MKAISPIVATVLIIAIVVVIAGIINIWIKNFTKPVDDLRTEANQQVSCAKGQIYLDSLRYCNNSLSGIIYNNGQAPLGNLTLYIIYQNATQQKLELNDSTGNRTVLGSGQITTFNNSIGSNYNLVIILTNCTDILYEADKSKVTLC